MGADAPKIEPIQPAPAPEPDNKLSPEEMARIAAQRRDLDAKRTGRSSLRVARTQPIAGAAGNGLAIK